MSSVVDEFDEFIAEVAPEIQDDDWKKTIAARINSGKVVPIISNAFTNELGFGDHKLLVKRWASYARYPKKEQRLDLPRMIQYDWVNNSDGRISDEVQVKEKYLEFLKALLKFMAGRDSNVSASLRAELDSEADRLTVSEISGRLSYPSLDWRENPLLLLAALPLPIFLTTSYHNFLEIALEKARKKPQTEICRWHDGLRQIPSIFDQNEEYVPSPEQPLVYHLYGLDSYPESLVLSEDDHLDFLANISKHEGAIHPRVTQALTQSSLVMMGYSVRDWDFRILFRGVIKPRPQGLWKTSVAVQLEDDAAEKEYVKKYLRQVKFEVDWTDTHTFIQELYRSRGG